MKQLLKFSGIDSLKKKANELWETIVHLETEKYDLEERSKRQDYDVSPFFFVYYMILHLRIKGRIKIRIHHLVI